MKRRRLVLLLFLLMLASLVTLQAQTKSRSAILLHHSTGGVIYGLEGAPINIKQQIGVYNRAHGLTGSDSVSCDESFFPAGHDNNWTVWKRVWNNEYSDNPIEPILNTYSVIVFKSCFTGSYITPSGQDNEYEEGTASDTLTVGLQTIYNYKWSFRHFLVNLASHPNNFFVIWDGAPADAGVDQNKNNARAQRFYDWVVDTLAKGLDSFGPLPRNVMIWDYFHKVVEGTTGYVQSAYESAYGDPHPSAAAAAFTAPQFVNEIFDAAIAYENPQSVRSVVGDRPAVFRLEQNYPNPFNPSTMIGFSLPYSGAVRLTVYNTIGEEVGRIVDSHLPIGNYDVQWSPRNLATGVYVYQLLLTPDPAGSNAPSTLVQMKKLLILK